MRNVEQSTKPLETTKSPNRLSFGAREIASTGLAAAMTVGAIGAANAEENPDTSPPPQPITDVFNADLNGDGKVSLGEFVVTFPDRMQFYAEQIQSIATEVQSSTEAAPSPIPEAKPETVINLKDYSLKNFLKLKDPKLNKTGFKKIMNKNIPVIIEGSDSQAKKAERKYISNQMNIIKDAKRYPRYNEAGFSLSFQVAYNLSEGQKAAKLGNIDIAKAYINIAQAYVRIGKSIIIFDKSDKEFDKAIKLASKQTNLNIY